MEQGEGQDDLVALTGAPPWLFTHSCKAALQKCINARFQRTRRTELSLGSSLVKVDAIPSFVISYLLQEPKNDSYTSHSVHWRLWSIPL